MSDPTPPATTERPTGADQQPASKRQRREDAAREHAAAAAAAAAAATMQPSSAASATAAASANKAAVLFVSGLPLRMVGLRKLLKQVLQDAWQTAHPAVSNTTGTNAAAAVIRNVKVSTNFFNHTRSFAHVIVRDAAVAAYLTSPAVRNMRLRLPGTPDSHPPLSIGLAQGKIDILFPFVPPSVRSSLRLDSTALFSVTDQESAQRTTQLLLLLTRVGAQDPASAPPLRDSLKVTKGLRTAAQEEAIMEAAKKAAAASICDHDASAAAATATADDETKAEAEPMQDTHAAAALAAGGGAASSATVSRAMVYSPDVEINRLVTELAESNWSLWTDLEGTSAVHPAEAASAAAIDASALTASVPPTATEAVSSSAPSRPTATSPLSITDACACAGGNSLDFGRHFAVTHAIEFDEQRAKDLQHNVRVLCLQDSMRVHQDDANAILPSLRQHILYVDPPWLGPNYKELLKEQPELFLGATSLPDLCWGVYERDDDDSTCRVIAMRLPYEYDCDALASRMVALPPSLVAEVVASGRSSESIDPFLVPRPLPFRVLLGKIWLVIFCLPSREERAEARAKVLGLETNSASASSSSAAPSAAAAAATTATAPPSIPLHFNLSSLDRLIYALNGFDVWHARECDPSFFDWEKARWIATKRWKGCTQRPAAKVHSEDKQRALQREGKDKKANGGGKPQSETQVKRKQERQQRYKAKVEAKQQAKDERRQARKEEADVMTDVAANGAPAAAPEPDASATSAAPAST